MSVIRVENLSKRYILSHQGRESYTALRDVMAERVKAFGRKVLHPFTTHLSPFTDSSHEEFWALKDVSFEINQGDRVGIIGRNGAGKSTLLKILSRIVEPTTGRVRINGRVASLLEVGTGFHPELTGRENIFLNGAILGMSRAEIQRKFDEIVAFAEIERFLDTPVKRYSSGMYVRLAFAVAAHLEPEILIVDEVLAVGDAQFQKKCLGKMEDVSTKEGRTVLFVSHNMSVVSRYCNHGIVLNAGKVAFNGPIAEAVNHYICQISESSGNTYVAHEMAGEEKPYLKAAAIINQEGVPVSTVQSGQKIDFVFDVANATRGLSLNFSIYNMSGYQIVNFNTLNVSLIDKISGAGQFVCEIEELLLAEGTYRVNVALVEGGAICQHLESVLVFDVCAATLRGRQIVNANFGTSILMHHRWTISE